MTPPIIEFERRGKGRKVPYAILRNGAEVGSITPVTTAWHVNIPPLNVKRVFFTHHDARRFAHETLMKRS